MNNGNLTGSIFINNFATGHGAGVQWSGNNGILTESIFINNHAEGNGGGVCWTGANGILSTSTFTNNTNNWGNGGAVYWNDIGNMINCSFLNSKSYKYNGIYTTKNLNINGGNGIVYLNTEATLSGISIVVLNNETYYYPPNTNINFTKKNIKQDMIE